MGHIESCNPCVSMVNMSPRVCIASVLLLALLYYTYTAIIERCKDNSYDLKINQVVPSAPNQTLTEACMEQFRISETYKFTLGRSVWIDPAGVYILCSLLRPGMSVLEFGAGGSTTFFSQFVGSWASVEHDPAWADSVTEMLTKLPWGDRVKVHTVEPDMPYEGGFAEGTEEQFHSYINYPTTLKQQYDVIIDDGRARALASKESRLIIHDWERVYYKDMANKLGYVVDKEDVESKRHLVSLKPPQDY